MKIYIYIKFKRNLQKFEITKKTLQKLSKIKGL